MTLSLDRWQNRDSCSFTAGFPFGCRERTRIAHTPNCRTISIWYPSGTSRTWVGLTWWSLDGHAKATPELGGGLGLTDPRSQLFHELIRVLQTLQRMQEEPVGFLLENVHSCEDARPLVQAAWTTVTTTLGHPVILDAAQVGSYAHRVRAYWTNLLPRRWLAAAIQREGRLAASFVDDILDAGRTSGPVTSALPAPFFPCNVVGVRRRALPTFVSYPNSQAYREGKAGILWDQLQQRWDVPNADER